MLLVYLFSVHCVTTTFVPAALLSSAASQPNQAAAGGLLAPLQQPAGLIAPGCIWGGSSCWLASSPRWTWRRFLVALTAPHHLCCCCGRASCAISCCNSCPCLLTSCLACVCSVGRRLLQRNQGIPICFWKQMPCGSVGCQGQMHALLMKHEQLAATAASCLWGGAAAAAGSDAVSPEHPCSQSACGSSKEHLQQATATL